ncbi:neutral zinc metallopeptidase [Streptosporangium sp. NBC_01469]|uniref:neutral zinc metallopeptidase n=1 Tax=Streptosporangium sp. NBC_01469 TaxID=2903898 RepID=UPI002E2C8730|nr:neutral zinc metallopeptidase [Streptosporangium sp. NBC_01469]
MRVLPSMVFSSVLVSLLLTGTAAAGTERLRPVPVGAAALTANPIYKAGELKLDTCPERPVRDDDFKGVTNYLNGILHCLNTSWKRQFTAAKLPFAMAKLRTIRRSGVKTGCNTFPKDAQAIYCSKDKTIVFQLDKNVLTGTSDLFLFEAIAHEYGHHVQQLSGIMTTFDSRKYRTKEDYNAASRRLELQADCLSGAFIGSVWSSLKRPASDFAYLRRIATNSPTHGKAANYSYWLNRGFRAKGPDACNTFAARSRVS